MHRYLKVLAACKDESSSCPGDATSLRLCADAGALQQVKGDRDGTVDL
jgi:hypothetical protein